MVRATLRCAVAALVLTAAHLLSGSPTPAHAGDNCLLGLPLLGCNPAPTPGPPTPVGPAPPYPPPPAPPEACAPVPSHHRSDFVAVSSPDLLVATPAYRSCTLNLEAASGIEAIREGITWSSVQRGNGRPNFAFYDNYVAALAQRRIRMVPILVGPSPAPLAPLRRIHGQLVIPPPGPGRNAGFAAFAAAAVAHYGHRGSFWRAHPELPRMVMTDWLVWNEPNLAIGWGGHPDPPAYARLLIGAHRAIKRADRRATVVIGGIPEARAGGLAATRFLRGVLAAGGRRAFDAVSMHLYSKGFRRVLGPLLAVRRLLDTHGRRNAGLIVGEYGWSTTGPPSPFRAGVAGQARLIAAALQSFVSWRHRLRLRWAAYFDWRDAGPPRRGGVDFWGSYTGLLDADGQPKPSLAAFTGVAQSVR